MDKFFLKYFKKDSVIFFKTLNNKSLIKDIYYISKTITIIYNNYYLSEKFSNIDVNRTTAYYKNKELILKLKSLR